MTIQHVSCWGVSVSKMQIHSLPLSHPFLFVFCSVSRVSVKSCSSVILLVRCWRVPLCALWAWAHMFTVLISHLQQILLVAVIESAGTSQCLCCRSETPQWSGGDAQRLLPTHPTRSTNNSLTVKVEKLWQRNTSRKLTSVESVFSQKRQITYLLSLFGKTLKIWLA